MTALPGKHAAPVALLAELTHRCPLGCPYCSNPLALDARADELDTAGWAKVFSQAAALGVLHAHLSGGEPAARHDLAEIVDDLAAQFSAGRARIETDVRALLGELAAKRMVDL